MDFLYRFAVVYVVSMVLWQAANAFVIKDQQFMANVTHCNWFLCCHSFFFVLFKIATDLAFENVSTAASSAVVIDEEEMQPVQSTEKETNETSTDETDPKKFNVEQVLTSFVQMKESVQIYTDDDDVKSTVKNEKEEDSSSDSDEEQDKLRHNKYSPPDEEDEDADDENTNKDDHEDDE